jgi:hypothetical protein
MHKDVKFCVRCVNKVTDLTDQTMGVTQGCARSPYLVKLFTNNIMDYINRDNTHVCSR